VPIKGKSPKETIHTEMHKFKHGSLHSGSKHGPLVHNRKQAIAIALSEAKKAGKKAGGGKVKAKNPSQNIEDRRNEENDRFNDSLYFPPKQNDDPLPPKAMPNQYGQLSDDLGATHLDLKEMGFADGGDVPDDSWKDREAQEGLALQQQPAPEPKRDWAQGLSKWWYGNQPAPGPDVQGNLPEADMTQDPVSRMLKAPLDLAATPGKAYQEGMTPDEQAEFGLNTALIMTGAGKPVEGGLGIGMGKPGAKVQPKFTKEAQGKIEDIHNTVIDASMWDKDSHPYGEQAAKALKTIDPKDIATSAHHIGISPEDLENLKSHMSPGAKAAFEKHYDKLPKAPEPIAPYRPEYPEVPIKAEEQKKTAASLSNDETEKALKAIEEALKAVPDEAFVSTEPSMGPEWNPSMERPASPAVTKSGYPKLDNHWIPNEPFDSHVRSLIQQHFEPVDWQKFNPLKYTSEQRSPFSMPPVPVVKTNDYIRSLGGRPDLPLWKGGNLTSVPAEIPHPQEKIVPMLGGPAKEKFEKAFFMADNKHVASMYGQPMPYIALTKNKVLQADFTDLAHKFGRTFTFSKPKAASYDPIMTKYIIDSAREQGADMVLLHNMMDLGGPQTQYAVLNTHILRAPHAKFDPTKLHLRHPLAGLVGGGLLTYDALKGEGDEKKMAKGGKVKHKQIDENPQDHEFIDFSRGGLIDSHIPGRTDKIPMRVRPGAFVLPADIPSALGEGNSKAGAEILKKMFTHSAYGLPPPNIHSHEFRYPHMLSSHHRAEGGKTDHVPIIAAGGEFIIHPDVVKHIGGGSMSAGHKLLTKFVLHTRKEAIKTLRGLKPPK
jgi:Family of unknown function (DUF6496)